MSKKRIFSGVQPSGDVHIGNYLGAIKNWVDLQDEFESIFCIVDLHAITVSQDPEELRRKTLEVAKVYLAAGIDPKKSTIYVQSQVSEHAELAWILNTITGMSELEKMTQFKDKSQKDGLESARVGLFDYPVLMAADILLYDTEVVPVGEDQMQHIELARTLARRFNKRFGDTFVVPKGHLKKETMRVMGLDDPAKKMSKSATSEMNYISLLDSPEIVEKKIKRAVTDSGSDITYSDDRPAIQNLINIYSSFSGKSPEEIVAEYEGKGFGEFKKGLTETVLEFIIPFQEKYSSLKDEEVIELLLENAKKVSSIAKNKMDEVKNKVGFLQ
ncbi:MAG: tryptophan--tRNA ligase [Candidatus Moranbacteria bacterium]|nr:tryptophan--tRNA ligase [Candidatus Moranbacteria bacterium]